jgi:hypothetical protein
MKTQKNDELKKKKKKRNGGIVYKHILINAKLEREVKKQS